MTTLFTNTFGDFKCIHCRQHISACSALSGVNNRNHCPYCLHSRHLDLYKAGDRLSACKGKMKPVALTTKREQKRYGSRQGELMIVHQCDECGKVSINRVAADDIADFVYEIYENSLRMKPAARAVIEREGIELLMSEDEGLVRRRLYGSASPAFTETYALA